MRRYGVLLALQSPRTPFLANFRIATIRPKSFPTSRVSVY